LENFAMLHKLKPLPRAIVIIAAVGGLGYALTSIPAVSQYLKPHTEVPVSAVGAIDLPTAAATTVTATTIGATPVTGADPIRVDILAWNAQAGLPYANGGVDTAPDSLMAKRGLKVTLTRQDMYDQMQANLAAFAKDPKTGTHMAVIMGDGYPAFAIGANTALKPFNQNVVVIGSLGYSRGEDKCVVDDKLSSLRGAVVAGVLGDGDINICIKKAADDGIPVNANPKTYDPGALNFVGTKDFVEADEKFIAGACDDRKNTVTGKTEKVCVNGSATWTPGDVKLAQKRGHIKVMASTKEYAWQMPATIIANKQWAAAHADQVKAFLAAAFEGGEAVRSSDAALLKAAAVEAAVYKEGDAAYWAKYFKGAVEMDKTGNQIFLGGSTSSGLADNAFLFGLNGNDNLYRKVYTVYGNISVKYFPDIMPGGLRDYDSVVDTSYLQALLASSTALAAPQTPSFGGQTTGTFASKPYAIEFETGKATFTPKAVAVLNDLLNNAAVTGLNVQINGHTDSVGDPASNLVLSKARAEAVKNFLMTNAPKNFPSERVVTRGFGDTVPVGTNAQNRRVEILLLK
jgi:outer membrane protein OmpA-like peptidoglycan-associated protein